MFLQVIISLYKLILLFTSVLNILQVLQRCLQVQLTFLHVIKSLLNLFQPTRDFDPAVLPTRQHRRAQRNRSRKKSGKNLFFIKIHCIKIHCIKIHCIKIHCIKIHCIRIPIYFVICSIFCIMIKH